MGKTIIQWTWRQLPDGTWLEGYTFNPWWGCLKVSEECFRCYAEGIADHYGFSVWGPAATTRRRLMSENYWAEPLRWNRQAERDGHRHSVFCASMADVYDEHPEVTPHRERLWELIGKTPLLNWLILTKRPQNILEMSPWGRSAWPDNVWIGTSVGLQKRAEERVPYLLEVPAVVRFLSCEPLIGSVNLASWIHQLQWVIAGGESGQEARVLNLEWARGQGAEPGVGADNPRPVPGRQRSVLFQATRRTLPRLRRAPARRARMDRHAPGGPGSCRMALLT